MNKSDRLDMDALIGNNDENLAASAINDAAVGASRIIYKADDPNIASIDDAGNITARSAGQTVITVSAVKDQAYLFINSDGMITNMSSPDEQTPVLSKSISLTVTENGGSDSPATGEGIDLQLCIAIAITSLCCAAVIIIQIRKKSTSKIN